MALDLDISLVLYCALRLSKWEPLLFIRDAPTRQILNVTEAECSFNLKELKNLTVGGGLSCHSFLKRLLFFFPMSFFPCAWIRRGLSGLFGVCLALHFSRALSYSVWGGGGARRSANQNERRKCAAP